MLSTPRVLPSLRRPTLSLPGSLASTRTSRRSPRMSRATSPSSRLPSPPLEPPLVRFLHPPIPCPHLTLPPFAVEACEYNFPYENVSGFLALSQVLEGVGTSAYLGAAGSIENKDFLLAACVALCSLRGRPADFVILQRLDLDRRGSPLRLHPPPQLPPPCPRTLRHSPVRRRRRLHGHSYVSPPSRHDIPDLPILGSLLR